MISIDVVVFDSDGRSLPRHVEDLPTPDPVDADRPTPAAIAARLNALVAAGSGNIVVFLADADDRNSNHVHQLTPVMESRSKATVWMNVLGNEFPAAVSVWQTLPARIAALLCRREIKQPLACRRDTLLQHGPFRAVDAPLWDWLIQATQAGTDVGVIDTPNRPPSSTRASAGGPGMDPLPSLVPSRPGPERDWLLARLEEFCGSEPFSDLTPEQTALHAGLFQWHDYLTESHERSQSIEGRGHDQLGDYWHAVMHRREPDYSNAKYWFRRIGRQAVFAELARAADQILRESPSDPHAEKWCARLQTHGGWNPAAFVDLCEACEHGDSGLALAARRIQQAEMTLLMHSTCRHAGARRE